jgi:hypothetical protein
VSAVPDTLASAGEALPATGSPPPRRDLGNRFGWSAITAMTLGVAATWLPLLFLPLGDYHSGRVDGRYALHVRNLFEKGLIGSDFSADWSPYGQRPYAHWPPLRNALAALFGLLPGEGPYEPRLGTYAIALLAIPAAAALLRAFGVRWIPTLVAVALMVATPFFWVYANQKFDLALILAASAAVVRIRRDPDPPRWLIVGASVLALLATLATWPGIAITGLLLIWLIATRRRLDRVVLWFGAAAALGLGLSLLFVVGITGMDRLVGQTEMRTDGGVTFRELFLRQGRYYLTLLPVWYLALVPAGFVAGLMRKQTRVFMAAAIVVTGVWIVGLRNGAYLHEFWGFLVLVPGVVGMGVLLDKAATLVKDRWLGVSAAAVGLVLALFVASMALGSVGDRYYYQPARAGGLVMETPAAVGQRYAWNSGLPAARWLAYYWDLPPRTITVKALTTRGNPNDLVVLRLDRLPDWLPKSVATHAVKTEGNYALVRVADVLAAAK